MSDILYCREIVERVKSFTGRYIYYQCVELVFTDSIESFNYRKKKRFEPITEETFKRRYGTIVDFRKLYFEPSKVMKLRVQRVAYYTEY